MFKSSRKVVTAQFVKFNLVGLLNTAIDFLVFTLLVWLGIYYVLAQIIAYGAGMVNSFFLNNRYTFKKDNSSISGKPEGKKRLHFIVWNAIMLAVSLLLLAVLTSLFHLDEVLAKVMTTVITVCINFYGSKKWVFAQHQAG